MSEVGFWIFGLAFTLVVMYPRCVWSGWVGVGFTVVNWKVGLGVLRILM